MSRRILVSVVSALVACGGGSTGKDTSALDFCNALEELSARRLGECERVPPELTAHLLSAYEASGACAAIQDSVSAGRARFDGAKADACLAALSSLSCDAFAGDVLGVPGPAAEVCAAAFAGTLVPGTACPQSVECANGFCMHGGTGPTCPGTCVGYLTAGQACSFGTEPTAPCAPGLSCIFDTSGSHCEAVAAAGLGESCAGGIPCAPELYCSWSSRTCAARQTSGPCTYVCSGPVDCPPGELCGIACLVGNECAKGYECTPDASGSAQCMPIVAEGGSCAAGERCAMGTHCDGTSCLLNPIVGQPCSSTSGFCIDGYCDGTTCRASTPDGAACSHWGECGPYSTCNNGVCESLVCR